MQKSPKEWKILEEDSLAGIVPGFGKKLNNILGQNLARYELFSALGKTVSYLQICDDFIRWIH